MITEVIEHGRVGGRLSVVALHYDPIPVSFLVVLMKQFTIRGSMEYPQRFDDALDLLARRDLSAMITHRFPLDRFDEAVATLGDRDCGKVMVSLAGPSVSGRTACRSRVVTTTDLAHPPGSRRHRRGHRRSGGRPGRRHLDVARACRTRYLVRHRRRPGGGQHRAWGSRARCTGGPSTPWTTSPTRYGDPHPGPLRPRRRRRRLPRAATPTSSPRPNFRVWRDDNERLEAFRSRNAAFAWIDAILAAMEYARARTGEAPAQARPEPTIDVRRPPRADRRRPAAGADRHPGRRDLRLDGRVAARGPDRCSPATCSARCSGTSPTWSPSAATATATP